MSTRTPENDFWLEGSQVILRDRQAADVDRFVTWQSQGEWRHLDAPWEGAQEQLTPAERETVRTKFLARLAADIEDGFPTPRTGAIIVSKPELRPVGWVNRYPRKPYAHVTYIGIDICEDDMLERGIGTEALRLWVDYLFTAADFRKIGLDTWSFNPRMMHVAEKVGFIPEGVERALRVWQGQELDLVHYGILRKEWPSSQ